MTVSNRRVSSDLRGSVVRRSPEDFLLLIVALLQAFSHFLIWHHRIRRSESTPGGEMSVEENKALVRGYFEEIDRTGEESVLDKYVSADFVDHSPSPGCTPDMEGLKAAFRMFRSGSPGTHRIDDIIAEGDKVVVRVTGQGVHSGELFGIPATQREFTATGITILRIADGKIVERWVEMDMLGALQQLGVIPESQSRV